MAIDVIEKDRKEIRWLGLSNETTNELSAVETELAATLKRVEERQKVLRDLVQRKIAIQGLISRNTISQNSINAQTLSSTSLLSETNIDGSRADRLYLPFILINAPRDCRVHCEMLEDRTQYFFEFDMSFFINEDIELLRLMGLDNATPDEMRAILTPEIHSYYQTRLKSSLPLAAPGSAAGMAALETSPAPHTPQTQPRNTRPAAAGRRVSSGLSMSSPVRPKRAAAPAVPGVSTLRQAVTAASLPPVLVPPSPQPIGYTGIFRKAPRAASAAGTQPGTPKQAARKPAANPFGADEFTGYGFSFSDALGGDRDRLL